MLNCDEMYQHIHQQIKTDKNVVERHAVRLDMHRHLLNSSVNIWTHLAHLAHLTSDVKEKRDCVNCVEQLSPVKTQQTDSTLDLIDCNLILSV